MNDYYCAHVFFSIYYISVRIGVFLWSTSNWLKPFASSVDILPVNVYIPQMMCCLYCILVYHVRAKGISNKGKKIVKYRKKKKHNNKIY